MMGMTRWLLARSLTIGAVAGVAALASAPNASATASPSPITVGTPLQSGPPAVAVDSAGDAIIAWANTKDLPPSTVNVVQWCVLSVGAKACTHSGTLTPADGAQYVDDVQVLVDGSTIVVLADVYGTQGPGSRNYVPEQEWASTDGGATFIDVNGGLSVADGIINADTAPLGAVILPGTNVLGYGWNTAGGSPPTFNAFPLGSPPECSTKTCSASYASLEPNTNPDPIGNAGGQFAAQSGPNAGVLGIFNTDFTNGPLGCSSAKTVPFGTAFAYGSGPQSATNDYNVSPGSPNSAWKVPVTLADCNVEYPAVGGGGSGFGVLEDNELTGTTVYHRFNAATASFSGTPQVTISSHGEQQPSVSQDGSGGVYATFLAGGAGGPIALAYSPDGGNAWAGPATLSSDGGGGAGGLTSSVNAAGQGWAAWTDNGTVFARSFRAVDALSPAIVGGTGTSTTSTLTVTVTCGSTPCTVAITIAAPPAKAKAKPVTLATGTFTIKTNGPDKLQLHLSKTGEAYLASHHGRLKASVSVSERIIGLTAPLTRKTVTITPKR